MKGIAHFSIGVAIASMFPSAVRAAAAGDPLSFILGGVFGLLPDTVDFKFARYFYPQDVDVVPDPNRPDPTLIANAVAAAVHGAWERGRTVRIRLNTIRLGADTWQRYEVTFDTARRRVVVRYGPVVDTGGRPVADPPAAGVEASVPLLCDVRLDYLATTAVDIFDGPVFAMTPGPRNAVTPVFIPWHRSWSHSFVVAALAGVGCTALWGPLAGMVAAAAYAAHVAADQFGFLGSNLWFPFSRRRTAGLQRMHAAAALPNAAAVWLSCATIFWNLYRAAPCGAHASLLRYALWVAGVPALAVWGARRLGARRAVSASPSPP